MRKSHMVVAAAAVVLGALAATASAQEKPHPASAQAGREFAGHNCDSCHVIAPKQDLRPLVAGYAPSFSDIANRPDTTAASLRSFLSQPHGYSRMPYPDLLATDRDNVIAFIMSLRGRH